MIVGGCWLLCWLPPPERSQWGSKQVAAKELTPKFESPGDFHENMREWLKVMEEIKPVILLLLHRKKGQKASLFCSAYCPFLVVLPWEGGKDGFL